LLTRILDTRFFVKYDKTPKKKREKILLKRRCGALHRAGRRDTRHGVSLRWDAGHPHKQGERHAMRLNPADMYKELTLTKT
jgi:hypothetical protein